MNSSTLNIQLFQNQILKEFCNMDLKVYICTVAMAETYLLIDEVFGFIVEE
jgi:hypothetical protein